MADTGIVEQAVTERAIGKVPDKVRNPVTVRVEQLAQEKKAHAALELSAGRGGRAVSEFADPLVTEMRIKPPADAALRANITAAADYLRLGYDGVDPADPASVALRDSMEHALRRSATVGGPMSRIMDPADILEVTEEYLRKDDFKRHYGEVARGIVSETFSPTPEQIKARTDNLTAAGMKNPGRTAMDQLRKEWAADVQARLQPNDLMSAALESYTDERAALVKEAWGDRVKLTADATLSEDVDKWATEGVKNWRGKAIIEGGDVQAGKDFKTFFRGEDIPDPTDPTGMNIIHVRGGRAILGDEVWSQMSEAEKSKFEKDYADKVFAQKLMSGNRMSERDLQAALTSDAFGSTFAARVKKMRDMVESNREYQRIRGDFRLDGVLNDSFWNNLGKSGAVAAGSAIAALLAMLVAPVAAPVFAAHAAVVAATAGSGLIGGGLKLAHDSGKES